MDEYDFFTNRLKSELENMYGSAIDTLLKAETDINSTNVKRGYIAALQDVITKIAEIKEEMEKFSESA